MEHEKIDLVLLIDCEIIILAGERSNKKVRWAAAKG